MVNWLYFTGLAGGSVAVVAVHKIANAKWSGVIIRFAAAARRFPPGVAPRAAAHLHRRLPPHLRPDAGAAARCPTARRSGCPGFMFGRLLVGLLGALLSSAGAGPGRPHARHAPRPSTRSAAPAGALRPDADAGLRRRRPAGPRCATRRDRRLAPLYVVLYALVMTLVAFDRIMALQPHWYSNLLGGFYFMGVVPRRPHAAGPHDHVRPPPARRLPTWYRPSSGTISASSVSASPSSGPTSCGAQFLVIWYGNMPEETGFVFARLWGPWLPIGRAVFLGMFLMPFIGLLGVAPKKTPLTLGFFATVSLVALWLERYLLVMPVGHRARRARLRPAGARGRRLLLPGLFLLAYAALRPDASRWSRRGWRRSRSSRARTPPRDRGHLDHEESADGLRLGCASRDRSVGQDRGRPRSRNRKRAGLPEPCGCALARFASPAVPLLLTARLRSSAVHPADHERLERVARAGCRDGQHPVALRGGVPPSIRPASADGEVTAMSATRRSRSDRSAATGASTTSVAGPSMVRMTSPLASCCATTMIGRSPCAGCCWTCTCTTGSPSTLRDPIRPVRTASLPRDRPPEPVRTGSCGVVVHAEVTPATCSAGPASGSAPAPRGGLRAGAGASGDGAGRAVEPATRWLSARVGGSARAGDSARRRSSRPA